MSLDDFVIKGEVVVKSGSVINEEQAEMIGDSGVENVRIRSILTFKPRNIESAIMWCPMLSSFISSICSIAGRFDSLRPWPAATSIPSLEAI